MMADPKVRLRKLNTRIQSLVQDIEQLTEAPNEPLCSFKTFAARNQILNAVAELEAVISEPQMYLTRLAGFGNMVQLALQAMHRLKIPNKLAPSEIITYEELAQRCGNNLQASDLQQLMRVAIAYNIFTEPRDGYVQHNAFSEALMDHHFNQWIGHLTEEIFVTSAHGLDAILKWPGSQELEETGYVLAHNSSKGYWEALKEDPIRTQRFWETMTYMRSLPFLSIDFLIQNLNWTADTSPSVLVDIGGSQGSLAIKLLEAFPRLHCIVQDLDEVVSLVQLTDLPLTVTGRLSFQAHNFFTQQPVKDADVYFMRSILHDWSDKYALQIIRNLIPALKPGARVICNEICLPEPSQQLPPLQARTLRGVDMSMKTHFNSKERDQNDWKTLFETASCNFDFVRVTNTPGSELAVIEFMWKGDDKNS